MAGEVFLLLVAHAWERPTANCTAALSPVSRVNKRERAIYEEGP
jgi:hypothetical protein